MYSAARVRPCRHLEVFLRILRAVAREARRSRFTRTSRLFSRPSRASREHTIWGSQATVAGIRVRSCHCGYRLGRRHYRGHRLVEPAADECDASPNRLQVHPGGGDTSQAARVAARISARRDHVVSTNSADGVQGVAELTCPQDEASRLRHNWCIPGAQARLRALVAPKPHSSWFVCLDHSTVVYET
jgi:hypothetical protein